MTHSTIDDAALAALIDDAGLGMTPAELLDLLSGINAAPEPPDADAWLALVAPDAGPELADRLRSAKSAIAGIADQHGPSAARPGSSLAGAAGGAETGRIRHSAR